MDMRGWVLVPAGGLSIEGVVWPAGPREVGDSAWYGKLKGAGAEVLTEAEFDVEVDARARANRVGVSKPGSTQVKARRARLSGMGGEVTPVTPVPIVDTSDESPASGPAAVVVPETTTAPKPGKSPRVKRVKIS